MDRQLKAYIAGPMRGFPNFNFPAFFAAEEFLIAAGYDVFNPARQDTEIDKFDPAKDTPKSTAFYMSRDLPVVALTDVLALLPGWSKSEGAQIEVMVAKKLNKRFLYLNGAEGQSFSPALAGAVPGALAEHRSLATGEVRVTDKITGGEKGQKPERFDLIPVGPLEELARVYGWGCRKYAEDNWRKGYSWRLSFGALMRHAWAFWRGEDLDKESGLHHLAHVQWHCCTLQWYAKHRPTLDDRGDKAPATGATV